MKILIATGIYPPDIGGPATMLKEMIASLEGRGFEVRVLTYSDKKGREDNVWRIKRGNKILMYLKYFLRMGRLSQWADIIYVTDTYSVGYFAYLIKKITGKKYVIRFAGDSAWEIASSKKWTSDYILDFQEKIYNQRIERMKKRRAKILINADKIIAVSHFLENLALKIGVKKEKIRVIYNAIDFLKNVKISPRAKSKKGKTVITICRLTPWKGVDGIIKILPELKKIIGEVNLLILGDGPELENLKNLASSLNLEKNVNFLGRVRQEEIFGYLEASDLFILNSNYEGFSHTILEAMKAGVPVITTTVGGNPEIIENGKDGLLTEYNNQYQLLKAVVKIFTDNNLRKTLVENAKNKLKNFRWDDTIKETVDVLEEK